MAKPHRKTTHERPMLEHASAGERELAQPSKLRSLRYLGVGIEAAAALEEWEAEGGASAAALRMDAHGAAAPSASDRWLLQRLGAALVSQWSSLPAPLQRALYERAVCVGWPPNPLTARREMARFLHDNNTSS